MSRIRTYVVGRDLACDVHLEDSSVSRRHAEVVRLPDGALYVTDCATTNGTFVLDRDGWHPIRQTFLQIPGRIRFGDCQMTAGRLAALCLPNQASLSAAGVDARTTTSSPSEDSAPDPSQGLVRDPETGEVIEKEPPPVARRRSRR